MRVFDIYSKRKKQSELAGKVDVYKYDELPEPFRVQVVHIWNDMIGPWHSYSYLDVGSVTENNHTWSLIHEILCKEKGVFSLSGNHSSIKEQCIDYLLNSEVESALDIIEVSFRMATIMESRMREHEKKQKGIKQSVKNATSTLNKRFKEHAIGYQFENLEIMRVD